MADAAKRYKLTVSLVSTGNDSVWRDGLVYEWILGVRFLNKRGQNATMYNAELNMHFIDRSALTYQYEVEFLKNRLLTSSRLEKSEDFIRKCSYRHDWSRLSINSKGQIVTIDNKEEMVERWKKLKSLLLNDYKGQAVNDYLTEIDSEFENTNKEWNVGSRYMGFGILFPQIPANHYEAWSNKRLVEVSEYEGEKFEEYISYEKTENDIRHYNVKGNHLANSSFIVSQFEGNISMSVNSFLPLTANIHVKYCNDDIQCDWSFELNKID